jgi:hypothetical protein
MVRHDEAEIGFLAPGQVFLQPAYLLAPETLSCCLAGGGVADVPVERDELASDQARVDFTLDKWMPAGVLDSRELGMFVTVAGLKNGASL